MRILGSFIVLLLPGTIAALLHCRRDKPFSPGRCAALWAVYTFIIDWLLCLAKLIRGHAGENIFESFSTVGGIVKYGALAVVLAVALAFALPYVRLGSKKPLTAGPAEKNDNGFSCGKRKHCGTFCKQSLLALLFLIPAVILTAVIGANSPSAAGNGADSIATAFSISGDCIYDANGVQVYYDGSFLYFAADDGTDTNYKFTLHIYQNGTTFDNRDFWYNDTAEPTSDGGDAVRIDLGEYSGISKISFGQYYCDSSTSQYVNLWSAELHMTEKGFMA